MKKLAYLTLALAAILINGCSNESLESTKVKVDESKKSLEFIILEDEALEMATAFLNKGGTKTRSASSAEVKTIWRDITLDASKSRNATDSETIEVPVYVVSYTDANAESDGYVVTVGDKRVMKPVLVYADKGNWDLSEIPEFEELFWNGVDNSLTQTLSESDADPCDTYEYEEKYEIERYAVDQFLTWGQSSAPYNDSVPYCTSTGNNMPVGCVALAMGQIMAKHEYPTSGSYIHQRYNRTVNATYNWAQMKANNDARLLTTSQGRSGVANILAEAGYKVNMKYGCGSSGAFSSDVPQALRKMGYKSSTYNSFAFSHVISSINYDNPVYIRGANSIGGSGHAWVVEGYKRYITDIISGSDCPEEYVPTETITTSIDYFYFNLGWYGNSNGMYLYDIFEPWPYQYDIMIITNITPDI